MDVTVTVAEAKNSVVIDDERYIPGAINLATSEMAMVYLARNLPIDNLFVDHDLGGNETTRDAVLYLAERAFNGDPYPVVNIYVHSMNPEGNRWIRETLSHYGYKVSSIPLPNEMRASR